MLKTIFKSKYNNLLRLSRLLSLKNAGLSQDFVTIKTLNKIQTVIHSIELDGDL